MDLLLKEIPENFANTINEDSGEVKGENIDLEMQMELNEVLKELNEYQMHEQNKTSIITNQIFDQNDIMKFEDFSLSEFEQFESDIQLNDPMLANSYIHCL